MIDRATPTPAEAPATQKQPDAWPPPIQIEAAVEQPPFPIECLPDILKGFALEISESLQVPVDMAAVKCLAAAATCVQGKYVIRAKPDYTEPLNIYVLTVLPPSERKTMVDQICFDPIYKFEKERNKRDKEAVDCSTAKKNALKKKVESMETKFAKGRIPESELAAAQSELTNFKEIKHRQLFADDTTPEALISLIAENGGRMSVISSEGNLFEIMAGLYSNSVNIAVFLKAHSGESIRIDRKGRAGEYIPNPCLTIALSIQPDVLRDIMGNRKFHGRGLISRFLYCLPVSMVGKRRFETKPISKEHSGQYRQLCYDLLETEPEAPEEITLSEQAYKLYMRFYEDTEARLVDDLEAIADWAGKYRGAVLRIAGLLHCAKERRSAPKAPVSPETMEAAISIGGYFLEHAIAAYQSMGADERTRETKYVMDKLRSHIIKRSPENAPSVTKRDLLRICRRYKRAEQLDEPLDALASNYYVREEKQRGGGIGRPPEPVYLINPFWINEIARDKCDKSDKTPP